MKSDHRIDLAGSSRTWEPPLFFILFLTFAYFYQGGFDGVNSRFDATLAMAFRGSSAIDMFHANTVDKIQYQGHYYSAKAPGAALLALPVALLFSTISDYEPFLRSGWMPNLALYLATVFSVALLSALSALLFRRLLLLLNPALTLRQSLVFTLATYLGTLLLPYSTVLLGHGLAASLLVIGTYFGYEQSTLPKPRRWRLVLSALAFGAAALCEYTAMLLVAPLVATFIWYSKNRLAFLAVATFAFLPALLVLAANLNLGLDPGLFGSGLPSAAVALQLLFGSYRGLFFYCPILLVAVSGLVRLPRGPHRPLVLAGVLGCILLWLTNSGYPFWQGGVCFGPRHLVPMIPFLALGFAFMPLRRSFWVEFAVLALVSLAANGMGTAISPFVDARDTAPLLRTYPQKALSGAVSLNPMDFLADAKETYPRWVHPELWQTASWNLGEKMGLRHWFSILPLLVVWLVFLSRLRTPR